MTILKNIKHGNKKFIFLIFLLFFYDPNVFSEEKILSSPLINLDELKPSFEEIDDTLSDTSSSEVIQNKKKNLQKNDKANAKFIGLDKITAKTSEITINIGETKRFGPLEIKVLKCGKVRLENKDDNVAYLQVKDVSENENEKVFIFNGWTFSSVPSMTPFDHAIYDLQLVNCTNV
jgi:hypothetical protein